MLGVMLFSIAVCASSEPDHRERGLPVSLGKLQAKAMTCARSLGGKNPGASRTGCLPKDGIFFPSPSPIPNGVWTTPHLAGNGGVVPIRMLPSQKQQLRSDDLAIGGRAKPGNLLKLCDLLFGKDDFALGFGSAWHFLNVSFSQPKQLREDTMVEDRADVRAASIVNAFTSRNL